MFLERAMVQALQGIGEEVLAIVTEHAVFGPVPIPAETMEHYFYGFGFTLQAVR